jgi:hypothetical protein
MKRLHKIAVTTLALCTAYSSTVLAEESWRFGLGTGLSALDVSGDGGFNTQLLGPVDFDASLSPSDVQDYMDTAFGFAFLAKKDKLSITASFVNLELQEDVSATQGANSGELNIEFKTQVGELMFDYVFSESDKHFWSARAGARYTKQEYGADLVLNNDQQFAGTIEDDWTDALVGLGYTYAISPTLSWNTKVDYGFGGSEGTTHFNTGLSKIYGQSWLVNFALDVKDIEYEEAEKGAEDWFFYDATETVASISFLYLF